MKSKITDLQATNQLLREELDTKDKEIEVMIDYLKDIQPSNKVEKENFNDNSSSASFGKKPEKNDPEKTEKMFGNAAHFGNEIKS